MKMKIAGAVLAAAVAGALFAGQAAAATQTVGVIQLVEHSALDAANRGIVDQMKARGMDVKFDQQNAQADQSNLHNIAQRFVTQKYPLIFAIATPAAQSVANATSKTPIVATAVTDFAVARLVKTNELPGTNVTGSSDMNPVAAQLDLLLKFVPNAKTIGTIYNSSEINSQFQIDILKKAVARKSGLKLVEVTISNVNDVQQAAQSLIGKIDALYLPTDNVIASAVPVLTRITNRARLPIIAGEEGMTRSGALATLGVDYYELGKIAGNMGADILEGKARPETMPIRFQNSFFFVKFRQDPSPRIRQDTVAIGNIGTLRIPCGRTAKHIDLLIQRTASEQDLPVGRSCCHIKCSRHKHHRHAHFSHLKEQLRKTDIKTDTHAHFPKLRVKNRDLLSRGQHIRFFKILSSRNVNIKQMDLSVLRDQPAFPVIDIRSVVYPVTVPLGNRSSDQPGVVLHGDLRKLPADLSALRLRKHRKTSLVIRAGKNLRKNNHIRRGSILQHPPHPLQILRRGAKRFLLNRQNSHSPVLHT